MSMHIRIGLLVLSMAGLFASAQAATRVLPLKNTSAEAAFYGANGNSVIAGEASLLLPFLDVKGETVQSMTFVEPRFMAQLHNVWEVNGSLGQRFLLKGGKVLLGAFISYDGRRTRAEDGTYFNQLTLGVENWFGDTYLGANGYLPFGKTHTKETKLPFIQNDVVSPTAYRPYVVWNGLYATYGGDVTMGYEIIPALDVFARGYVFGSDNVDTYVGGVLSGAYRMDFNAGILHFAELRANVGYDGPNGFQISGGIALRVSGGMNPQKAPTAALRHFYDPVRRDFDIKVNSGAKPEQKQRMTFYGNGEVFYNVNVITGINGEQLKAGYEKLVKLYGSDELKKELFVIIVPKSFVDTPEGKDILVGTPDNRGLLRYDTRIVAFVVHDANDTGTFNNKDWQVTAFHDNQSNVTLDWPNYGFAQNETACGPDAAHAPKSCFGMVTRDGKIDPDPKF